MMKPGIGTYDRFKQMFDAVQREAGKKQYHLIPYFIAAHPGTSDEDMMNLALWLKSATVSRRPGADLPQPDGHRRPRCTTRGMNPLKGPSRDPARAEKVDIVRGEKRRRRLHKAFLRYHDPNNWPLLRDALKHGPRRPDRQRQAPPVPSFQPATDGSYQDEARRCSVARDSCAAALHVDRHVGGVGLVTFTTCRLAGLRSRRRPTCTVIEVVPMRSTLA